MPASSSCDLGVDTFLSLAAGEEFVSFCSRKHRSSLAILVAVAGRSFFWRFRHVQTSCDCKARSDLLVTRTRGHRALQATAWRGLSDVSFAGARHRQGRKRLHQNMTL
eukprot:s638_g14.t1